jgi:hypothetical protein
MELHHVTAKEQKIVHLNVRGAEYYCDTSEKSDNADTSDVGHLLVGIAFVSSDETRRRLHYVRTRDSSWQ